MTFNPHSTAGPSRTRQWRAIELANKSQHAEDTPLSSVVALLAMTALILIALFALPI